MKYGIWLSFDLGVRGDYEGMYTWLDAHGAKECGDSLAYLVFDCQGELQVELTKGITESVEINKKSRVYVIYRDPQKEKYKGTFLIGGRKAAPWSGSARGAAETDIEEN